MEPAVADVGRVADLTAQHGAAAVQGILGLGLLCELEGRGLDGQNCERGEKRRRVNDRSRRTVPERDSCFGMFRSDWTAGRGVAGIERCRRRADWSVAAIRCLSRRCLDLS
ncbi:hypothetical protein EYF80_028452 [Liparis tanakae]|uniref:Uncharacterized protein n=1 Tax=Liparis tanakae TaxID=230148 RepID=A0A4Z2H7W5_9TELE|nr:hypothetical protein EYF80_028452 [Liparis tanakae]